MLFGNKLLSLISLRFVIYFKIVILIEGEDLVKFLIDMFSLLLLGLYRSFFSWEFILVVYLFLVIGVWDFLVCSSFLLFGFVSFTFIVFLFFRVVIVKMIVNFESLIFNIWFWSVIWVYVFVSIFFRVFLLKVFLLEFLIWSFCVDFGW